MSATIVERAVSTASFPRRRGAIRRSRNGQSISSNPNGLPTPNMTTPAREMTNQARPGRSNLEHASSKQHTTSSDIQHTKRRRSHEAHSSNQATSSKPTADMSAKPYHREAKRKHSSEECVICLQTIYRSEPRQLECGHRFHSLCISRWKRYNQSCPICRRSLAPPPPSPLEPGTPYHHIPGRIRIATIPPQVTSTAQQRDNANGKSMYLNCYIGLRVN